MKTREKVDKTFQLKMKKPNGLELRRTYKSASEQTLERSKLAEGLLKFNNKPNSKCFNNHKSETHINAKKMVLGPPSVRSSKGQLIPTPKTPKQPKETLRKSLSRLKSSQWNNYASALRDIVQVSRFSPHLLVKSMPAIYKGITKLLKILRITTARTACQAANELFMNIRTDQSSEFDELVHTLLQKTADPNKYLQKDALEALNSMVIHAPQAQTIKILIHRRIAGYSLSVRITASKLLACVLDESDVCPTVLSEDLKTRMVFTAMRYLEDECFDIKFHGMRLLTILLQHKDFEEVFRKKISLNVLHRINKTIENVRVTVRKGNL